MVYMTTLRNPAVSAFRLVLHFVLLVLTAACATSVFALDLAASLTSPLDSTAATVPRTYLSTTTDIATFVDHDHCNFSDPVLRAMTSALRCRYMRVGGTQGDFTFYNNFPGSTVNVSTNDDLPPHFHRVFSYRQWRGLLDFVRATNLAMYFGLNAGLGGDSLVRNALDQGLAWVPNMASWLVNDLVTTGDVDLVAAFEFSNEPNLFPFGGLIANATLAWALNGTRLAHDIASVRRLLNDTHPLWKLVCCDAAYVPLFGEIDFEWVPEFAAAGGLAHVDETTFHFYPLLSGSFNKSLPPWADPFYASVGKVLQPFILNQVGYWADRFVADSGLTHEGFQTSLGHRSDIGKASAFLSVPVILGETGSAVGGGQDGLSNRYADVMEYVDKIGQMTLRGQNKMFRQTLCGSGDQYYALISHNLTAHPSFFVTAFWNRIVFGDSGNMSAMVDVYNVTSSDPLIRPYAFADVGTFPTRVNAPAESAYIIYVIGNLNADSAANVTVQLPLSGRWRFASNATVYAVTISSGEEACGDVDVLLSSSSVRFNGVVAYWSPEAQDIVPAMDRATLLAPQTSTRDYIFVNTTAVVVTVPPVAWGVWWVPVIVD